VQTVAATAGGPSLRGVPIGSATGDIVRLLSHRQQSQLSGIATELHLPPRMIVYREDSCAQCVFIVGRGTVKAFRDLPSGKRRVMAFMFQDDLFGLAEGGHYVHTAQTISAVTLYRIQVDALTPMLRCDPELVFQFLGKVAHELRASLRQTIIVGRRDAVGRLAMFLHMLEQHSRCLRHTPQIEIPMSRSDTANYLGLTLEAVCRASRTLERMGIIAFTGRHVARIVDRRRFDKLVTAL
jgi:CRP/FNR family transcriptional regulator, anaerobic regulatory protein